MCFTDDGVLGYPELATDFAGSDPFGPEFAQTGDGAFRPRAVIAVHGGLLSSLDCREAFLTAASAGAAQGRRR